MTDPIQSFVFAPASEIPNSRLPLLLYPRALPPALRIASGCQALFKENGWGGNWVDGIFDYWHFHVTGHEVLGCVDGEAEVGFGGDGGVRIVFRAGDVVVVPAGVGHKRLSEKRQNFTVIGGYPPGQDGTIAKPGDMPLAEAQQKIAALALPTGDPVEGQNGPLLQAWNIR